MFPIEWLYGLGGGLMIGLAVGPALGAAFIDGDEYTNVNLIGAVLFVLSFALIVLPVLQQRRNPQGV